MQVTFSRALTLAILAAPAVAQTPPVTDNPHDFTNFNVEPTKGFLWSQVDGSMWALNSPASQLLQFSSVTNDPSAIFQTLLYPTAVAEFGPNLILVVGGGSHALAIHDRFSGDVLGVVELDSEPADIVVDPDRSLAYISCMGDNTVLEVDPIAQVVTSRVEVDADRPRFLHLDLGQPGPADNRVFVAPFLSGNNSTSTVAPVNFGASMQAALNGILDLSTAPIGSQLPDEDLFSFDTGNMAATIAPVLRGSGTLMTGHGFNPATSQYWMLNVDSLNADPSRTTEPAINGEFALNRASIWNFPAGGGAPTLNAVDLDDIDPNPAVIQYSPATAVAFPFGLAFHPLGFAGVTAPMSDKVAAFDPFGARLSPLDVAFTPGSIPLHLEFHPVLTQFFAVYCMGTNTVELCEIGFNAPIFQFRLGNDPTPQVIQDGREIWYDADRSLNGRTSCNTCHPAGKADGIAWRLSNPPHDHKDAMVTQSLLSIEDTFPYHWRGERDLLAFNDAFTELLGGSAPLTTGPNSEFEAFQEFIFSLQAPANPRQAASRAVVPGGGGDPAADGVNGLAIFQQTASFPGGNPSLSCVECHQLPSGTNSDIQQTDVSVVPSQISVEVAHLREMRHKDQPIVNGKARSGYGLSHSGSIANLFGATQPFSLGPQQRLDVMDFLQQFDNGISPASHTSFFLNDSTGAPAGTTSSAAVAGLLHPQVSRGAVDAVVFGEFNAPPPLGVLRVRWLFNPLTGLYEPNSSAFGPQPIAALAPGSAGSLAVWAVAMGVPPGNGNRIALDPDSDELTDQQEAVFGTQPFVPDTDGDNFVDGYEVNNGSNPGLQSSTPTDVTSPSFLTGAVNGLPQLDFVTTSLAKFTAISDEDARIEATLTSSAPFAVPIVYESQVYGRNHTIVLQGIIGSTNPVPHKATFQLRDRAGLVSQQVSIMITPAAIVTHPSRQFAIEDSIRVTSFTGSGVAGTASRLDVTGTQIQLELREPGDDPTPGISGQRVVAQVAIKQAGTNDWVVSTSATSPNASITSALTVSSLPYLVFQPEFLVSNPTSANGIASIDFSQGGLSSGDEVRLNIIGILEDDPSGVPFDFAFLTLGTWSMPDTPAAARFLKFPF